MFTPLFIVGLAVKAYITLKARNGYGAMFIHSLGVAINTILAL
ncbi:MAG: hypothetical protein AOA65_1415 [Candidatus Bathyarchaeota archaeon BA1]|nr:MAG: hypothetical protein AOA65_1415 [Candidatus Bathyarchaeota archaeon BA1]